MTWKPGDKSYAEQKLDDLKKEIVESVIKDMQDGKPFKWNSGHFGEFPKSLATNKRYQGMNLFLLDHVAEKRGYKDSRWGTYRGIQALGGKVKKGETGTTIVYWQWERPKTYVGKDGKKHYEYVKDEEGNYKLDKNGNKIKQMVRLQRPFIKVDYVFNMEQTEGIPLEVPKEVAVNEAERNEKLDTIIKNSEARIFHDQNHHNYYSPIDDEIHVMPMDMFKTLEDYYGTVAHEIAHSTGHSTRLNRDTMNMFGSPEYAKEELTAEMSSMLLARQYSLTYDENHQENHKAYIRSWIKTLQDNPDELFKAVERADKAVRYIEGNMLYRDMKKEKTVEKAKEQSNKENIHGQDILFKNKDLSDEQKVQLWNTAIDRVKKAGNSILDEAHILGSGSYKGESYNYHNENCAHWVMGMYNTLDEAFRLTKERYLSDKEYKTILKEVEQLSNEKTTGKVKEKTKSVKRKLAIAPKNTKDRDRDKGR